MRKSLLAVALMVAFNSAFACGSGPTDPCTAIPVTPTPPTTAAFCNQVGTSASVIGNGSSYSAASGTASATAIGTQTPTASGLTITGNTAASNTGYAYNVSTGNGTGSASSVGNASANVTNSATNGGIHLQGTSQSNTNISIVAGTNQGGYAGAESTGGFTATGDKTTGTISDTKTSTSEAWGGGYTGLHAATQTANASSNVNVSGKLTNAPIVPPAPPGGSSHGGDDSHGGSHGGGEHSTGGNNGFGNGDQDAPGHSKDHNNAENLTH